MPLHVSQENASPIFTDNFYCIISSKQPSLNMPGLTSETKAAYTNGTKTNGVKTTIATSKKGDAPAKSSNEILFGVLDNITAESFSNEHDRSQALLAAYNLVARLETAWDFFARLCMGQVGRR